MFYNIGQVLLADPVSGSCCVALGMLSLAEKKKKKKDASQLKNLALIEPSGHSQLVGKC